MASMAAMQTEGDRIVEEAGDGRDGNGVCELSEDVNRGNADGGISEFEDLNQKRDDAFASDLAERFDGAGTDIGTGRDGKFNSWQGSQSELDQFRILAFRHEEPHAVITFRGRVPTAEFEDTRGMRTDRWVDMAEQGND